MTSHLVLVLSLGQYSNTEAQALFVEANDAYYANNFVLAKEKYTKLTRAGFSGNDVLFNLGTTHLAAGELGPAVFFLERARRLGSDDDIEANLAVAKERQSDHVVGEELQKPFSQRVAEVLPERLTVIFFLSTWWLGIAGLWTAWRTKRTLVTILSTALLLISVISAVALAISYSVSMTIHEAVVMATSAAAFEHPGSNAKTLFEVHAGLLVRVMETSEAKPTVQVRIRLPNALEGWVDAKAIENL
jgi:hypothetical protein